MLVSATSVPPGDGYSQLTPSQAMAATGGGGGAMSSRGDRHGVVTTLPAISDPSLEKPRTTDANEPGMGAADRVFNVKQILDAKKELRLGRDPSAGLQVGHDKRFEVELIQVI